MNIQKLQSLIGSSKILTDAERSYWIASLPKMSADQHSKLQEILAKAEKISWTEQVQKYFSLITKAAAKV
jgi:predicted glycosyltransferase